MKRKAQDIIYAAVAEAHVEDQCNKCHDPLLKLYYGRPLYINHNEDVAGCVANGAICEFRGVKRKPAVSQKDFETIIIDGYNIWILEQGEARFRRRLPFIRRQVVVRETMDDSTVPLVADGGPAQAAGEN
ncbi:hypothetical protein IV203_033830 [Nitzschia inconspicua]|uniref:Uncharacterized protein n=1 Tax=Nitzschia inconspicua TaxID=303405 RepID=A0A9K3Q736_9STRA|nr:hypothetical protein IV203_033830 [Nitzschia inconspicua]